MSKTREELKILLIQIRDDVETREEELNEFVRFSGLNKDQFSVLDVFKTPSFEPNIVDDHDAVFVGGSSDASVLKPEKFSFVESANELFRYCVEIGIPVLASCFGFQGVVEALGGKVILDAENMEMGTYIMTLNEEGKNDPLFKDMPETFWAVSGHKERAGTLPDNAINMASSEKCPYHIIKIKEKPFYAFQFHPEVDRSDLITRITRYKDRYLDDDGALQKIIDECKDTPEANEIIRKFVDRIILPNT